MLGQSKKNILFFIKLLSLRSKDPNSTEKRWTQRLTHISMNNGEWPNVMKNINYLVNEKAELVTTILQIITALPDKETASK